MGYKLFIPARHGLGDNLGLIYINGKSLLSKVNQAWQQGMVEEVLAVFEEFMNPSIPELYSNLPFPVRSISTRDQEGVALMGVDNSLPDTLVGGHRNIFTNMPEEITALPGMDFSLRLNPSLPFSLPSEYIHFVADAGRYECILRDPEILWSIKEVFPDIPIVQTGKAIPRNGMAVSPLTADIDLREKAGIIDTLTIARGALLGISAVSYLRLASALCGLTVLELVPNNPDLINEINFHYQGCYGVQKDRTNFWFLWPEQRQEFLGTLVEQILRKKGRRG